MISLVTPHLQLIGVLELDAGRLRSMGIDGLLLDVDHTLKEYGAEVIPQEIVEWIAGLRDAGFRLCLLSNGKPHRIARLAASLGVPFVAKAFKPLPFACRAALGVLGLPANRVALIGDQIFADVLAGRLAGLTTILVTPMSAVEPWFTRLKRPLERLVLRRIGSGDRIVIETLTSPRSGEIAP